MQPLRQLAALLIVTMVLTGCRTPVRPATVPVANLYPTLHPGSILDQTCALKLTGDDVTTVLVRLGVLTPLIDYGMGRGEVPVVLRGLEQHGYAELDARRTACPVRWVVLRGVLQEGEPWFVAEAGQQSKPAHAAQWGIDLAKPPVSTEARSDVYGRRSTVEVWRASAPPALVEVHRVLTLGAFPHWELEYRAPIRASAVPSK